MSSRQLTLTVPRSRPDSTADVNLVRLIRESVQRVDQEVNGVWECGRDLSGVWTPSDERGPFAYTGTDFTDYQAEGAGAAGQDEAQQDWILEKLINAGIIGAGTKGSY